MNTVTEYNSIAHKDIANKVIESILIDNLKKDFLTKKKEYEFNLQEAKELWLDGKSEDTKNTYTFFLDLFLTYIEENNFSIHLFTYKMAVELVSLLNKSEASASYVNLFIATMASFYNYLISVEEVGLNPFLNLRNRPKMKRKKELCIPSDKEFNAIIKSFEIDLHSESYVKVNKANFMLFILYTIRDTGLRSGAFNEHFTIKDDVLSTVTKGSKKISHKISDRALTFFKKCDRVLDNTTSKYIQKTFELRVKDLYDNGLLESKYSLHDIRHLFAVELYKEVKDIYKVSKRLDHENVGTTQTYLSSLNVLDIE